LTGAHTCGDNSPRVTALRQYYVLLAGCGALANSFEDLHGRRIMVESVNCQLGQTV
jgi:hypothetical protein